MRGVCTPHVGAGEGEAATDSDFHPETANCSERGVCDTHCVCMSGGAKSGGGSSTGRESATEGIRREICRQHHLCKIMSA